MPSVSGKRVVIFGDSLSSGTASPGGVLGRLLTDSGATVQINARVGRSAHNFWGREDTAAQLSAIRAFDPDIVLVQLGTNDLGLSMGVDRMQMTKIRDQLAVGGADVYAFGPPSFASELATAQAVDAVAMMKAVFGDRLIDLRPLTHDMTSAGRSGDGVHFTATGASVLGERMFDAFTAPGVTHFVVVLALLAIVWTAVR